MALKEVMRYTIELGFDGGDAERDSKKSFDKIEGQAEKLEGKTRVIDVDVNDALATPRIKALDRRLASLTDEDRQVILKAQAKQLQSEVDSATKKLAQLDRYDDEEIKLIIKARDGATSTLKEVQGELGKVENAADDADEELGGIGQKLQGAVSGRFSGIGGKMGKELVAGFAAVGVGALLMKGISQAMDAREGVKRLQGQFAFTADEAKKYGDLAGDLYSEGWGEGVEEVQQVVGLAAKKLGATTEAELSGISEAVLAVTRTWGEDFDAVIRSTDQLIQNGLAPNATAALDLIVTAFQNGGNEAGDLLDTIDEYSQHWAAMGLSGEDALNQIIHGFQNGQRDADKLGDAVKEMRLRVTEDTDAISDAYDSLGLDADAMRLKFLEGGDSAREAFLTVLGALQDVEDPIERNRLAIELIGTQFEDLGPNAVDSLMAVSGALDDATGSAKKLSDTVEATEWEKLTRDLDRGLGNFLEGAAGKANSLFTEIARDMDGGAVGVMIDYGEALDAGRVAATEFDMALLDSAESMEEARLTALAHFDALGMNADAAATAANVVGLDWKSALDESAAAEQAAKDASLEHTAAQLEAAEAAFYGAEALDEEAESLEGVGEAADDAADEIETLTEQFSELLDGLADRSAYNSAIDGFDGVLRAAEKANNTSEMTAREAAAAQRDHEEAVSSLKREIIRYADEVGNIPPEAVSRIVADIDRGSIDEAERLLAALERTRVVNVRVQTAVSNVSLPKFFPSPSSSSSSGSSGGSFSTGAGGKAIPAFDTGGVVGGRRGEAQLAVVHGGETVLPTHKTGAAGAGGVSINIGTITTQAANGDQLLEELARAARRQGAAGIRRSLGIS